MRKNIIMEAEKKLLFKDRGLSLIPFRTYQIA